MDRTESEVMHRTLFEEELSTATFCNKMVDIDSDNIRDTKIFEKSKLLEAKLKMIRCMRDVILIVFEH